MPKPWDYVVRSKTMPIEAVEGETERLYRGGWILQSVWPVEVEGATWLGVLARKLKSEMTESEMRGDSPDA